MYNYRIKYQLSFLQLTARFLIASLLSLIAVVSQSSLAQPHSTTKDETMSITANELINTLDLEAHVEGGYFRRTFQADHRDKVDTEFGPRFTLTSIYYLLTDQSPIGHWHLNRSDIIHFFHLGAPITYYLIDDEGKLSTVTMGPDPTQGHQLQMTVKGGTWKASHLTSGEYGLISEAVAPGFDFEDMTLGDTPSLFKQFPEHEQLIKQFSTQRHN